MEDDISQFLKISIPLVFCGLLTILAVVRGYDYKLLKQSKSDYESRVRKGGERIIVEGILLHHPFESGGLQVLELANLRIITTPYPKYQLGDYVRISRSDCNESYCYYPKIMNLDKSKASEASNMKWVQMQSKFFVYLNKLRALMIARIHSQLPEPHAGLVLGMTIGYKEDFPDDFKELLITTGVMHVVVVSGYNVALILGFISKFLLRFGRIAYVVSSSIILAVFVLLVGFDPPVIRAAIMGFIAVFAMVNGRERNAIYLLVVVGLLMMVANPAFLYSLSFQMSIVATSAVLITSILIPEETHIPELLKDLLILIVVNASLFPIISYNFGRISLVSIPVNLLIAWTIPFITILGFLLMLVPNIIVAVMIVPFIDYFILVCNAFDQLQYASIPKQISITEVVFFYGLMLFALRVIYLVGVHFSNVPDD